MTLVALLGLLNMTVLTDHPYKNIAKATDLATAAWTPASFPVAFVWHRVRLLRAV
jgi:hypothetical protein